MMPQFNNIHRHILGYRDRDKEISEYDTKPLLFRANNKQPQQQN
jgi:hypothetical protein